MKKYSMMVVLILFVAASSFLLSQEGRGTGRVAGVVEDEAGSPIEGVKITLESLSYDLKLDTVSDEKGKWSIFGFASGAFRVTAEKEGYLRATSQVELSRWRNPLQKIVMKKIAALEQPVVGEEAKADFRQANDLYEQGKYKEALIIFQGFIEQNPELYKVWINVGNSQLALREFDKAIAAYRKVLDGLEAEGVEFKGNRTVAQLYAGIGEAYMSKDNLAEAEKYFKLSIEIDPADHALAYNVAEILFNINKVDEAIKYYQMAATIKPDWPKSYLKLGYAYLNKGDMQKAVEAFEKFLEKAPDDPQADTIRSIVQDLK